MSDKSAGASLTRNQGNETPFNNPAAQPELVEMWRNNLKKSQQALPEPPVLPTVISVNFDGGGQPLVAGLAGLVEVTFPCRILSCHMYAGSTLIEPINVTATVDLRRGQQGIWSAGSHPLYGTTMPSMTAQAESSPSITGWEVDLQPGDLIVYRLATFTGTATWLTLTLPVKRIDVTGVGELGITDSGTSVTVDGVPVVLRS